MAMRRSTRTWLVGLSLLAALVSATACGVAPAQPVAAPVPGPTASPPAPSVSSASGSAPSALPAAGSTARPAAASTAAPAGAPGSAPPLARFQVALAAHSGLNAPIYVAQAAGYFTQRGLDVRTGVVSASASAAALEAGSVQLYFGGATPVAADLGGADLIYIGDAVDHSTLQLIGRRGITTFPQLRGGSVSTTSPGAFGDVALHATAPRYGMVAGRDFRIVYNTSPTAAVAELTSGRVDAMINTWDWTTPLLQQGYPMIINYFQQGFRIIGPAMAVRRSYYDGEPAVLKAFLEGYLQGLRRTLDDPAFAQRQDVLRDGVTDAHAASNYASNVRVWNQNLTVNPRAIQVILNTSSDARAKTMPVSRLYDNGLIDQVNRDYGRRLFPKAFT
jgi:ABC-type nitrate/sulfonate/bicarbonate transport system substrate-binding protein